MHRLKNYLKSSEVSINKNIVEIQSEIDVLFEEFLNEPSNIKNKVEREIKTNTKFFKYGYLRSIKDVYEKIQEFEEEDMFEFESALDELNISERELKSDI